MMKLILKNIGLLKEAEVTLHRLSVIAGENDNGKSTVGKVAFCIIKAINRYKEDLKVSKSYEIGELLREAFFSLRRVYNEPNKEIDIALRKLRRIFVDDSNMQEMLVLFNDVVAELHGNPIINDEATVIITELEEKVKDIALQPEDSRQAIEQAFVKVFTAEFDSDVLLAGAKSGAIQLWENEICLIDLVIHKDNTVELQNEVEPIELKDATFIETPLIFNYHDLLLRSKTMLEAPSEQRFFTGAAYTTLHTKDLFNKLKQQSVSVKRTTLNQQLLMSIEELIKGSVVYSRESRDFIFSRDDKEISIKNTASGIKAFGILQVLLANDFINKNTLLIIDEPENHLHPKWQIKLAEILVVLAESGVNILVSAHSPYMIEALERYSEKYNIKNQSGFYLANDRTIENKNKLSEIFALLAEPFEVFREMDAEVMQGE